MWELDTSWWSFESQENEQDQQEHEKMKEQFSDIIQELESAAQVVNDKIKITGKIDYQQSNARKNIELVPLFNEWFIKYSDWNYWYNVKVKSYWFSVTHLEVIYDPKANTYTLSWGYGDILPTFNITKTENKQNDAISIATKCQDYIKFGNLMNRALWKASTDKKIDRINQEKVFQFSTDLSSSDNIELNNWIFFDTWLISYKLLKTYWVREKNVSKVIDLLNNSWNNDYRATKRALQEIKNDTKKTAPKNNSQ
jgi:hypothetical protein